MERHLECHVSRGISSGFTKINRRKKKLMGFVISDASLKAKTCLFLFLIHIVRKRKHFQEAQSQHRPYVCRQVARYSKEEPYSSEDSSDWRELPMASACDCWLWSSIGLREVKRLARSLL